MRYFALFLIFGSLLAAETFPAKLEKTLWPDSRGTVQIDDQGVSYTARKQNQSRRWTWLDIQYFDRISRTEFVILTYRDDWRLLGRDREYRFRILKGELSDSLFQSISRHLNRPVTDRVPPHEVAARYTIPVKHERAFGGTEGELAFSNDAIYYVTKHEADGRTWRMDRDVVSAWSDDPYRLEIRVYDNNRREFSRTATYKFDLKERLDPDFYRELKLKLYRLEVNHQVIR